MKKTYLLFLYLTFSLILPAMGATSSGITETYVKDNFVNITGDTMTGTLSLEALNFKSAVGLQSASTSGVPTMLAMTSAAHTGITASTEDRTVNWDFSATKTWAAGAVSAQREFVITAPTYAFASASTISNAFTVLFTPATAGTNCTITNNYALGLTGAVLVEYTQGAVATPGVSLSITTSGAGAAGRTGLSVAMLAGTTTSGQTNGITTSNLMAGTSTAWAGSDATFGYYVVGNRGLNGYCVGTTTGTNTGGLYIGAGGNLNMGLLATACKPKNSSTNVGITGVAYNTGTGSPIQIGGFFTLGDFATSAPTWGTSAALIADNAAQTSEVFVARDNGVAVFSIPDGGIPLLKTSATITASTTQTQGQSPLTAVINNVSTCATTNDVVTLPAAVAGQIVYVFNNGAQTLQIFPASGDNLGAGTDTSKTLAAGKQALFISYDATNWQPVLGANLL